jgi:putative membrane protein
MPLAELFILAASCLAGVLGGLVSGLIPGLHVNLIVFIILGAGIEGRIPPEPVTVFVVSLAVAQVFVSFVPSVFLRAPAGGTAVAIFPGDRMLQRGEGPSAVVAALTGGLHGSAFAILGAFVCFFIAPRARPGLEGVLKPHLGWILGAIIAWFMLRDLDWRALAQRRVGAFAMHAAATMTAFALVAQLSEVALSGTLVSTEQGIMSAFSGMFGAAILLGPLLLEKSAARTAPIPQRPAQKVDPAAALAPSVLGAVGGAVVGLLPAVGTAEMSAAICGIPAGAMPLATRKLDADRRYLLTVGAVGAADAMLALAAIFLIGKSRSGASIGVEHLLGDRIAASTDEESGLLLGRLLFFALVAAVLAFLVGRWIANEAGRFYSEIRPLALSKSVVLALTAFCALTGGLTGLLIFAAAAAIGLLFLRLGIRPASLMAFLLIPAASFFLGMPIPGLPLFHCEPLAIHSMPNLRETAVAIVTAGVFAIVHYRFSK